LLQFSQLKRKLISGSVKKLETHHSTRRPLCDVISDHALDFVTSLLSVDPINRISSASNALKHKWLNQNNEFTCDDVNVAEDIITKQVSNSGERESQSDAICCCEQVSCVVT